MQYYSQGDVLEVEDLHTLDLQIIYKLNKHAKFYIMTNQLTNW